LLRTTSTKIPPEFIVAIFSRNTLSSKVAL